jgi:hypothetical protein
MPMSNLPAAPRGAPLYTYQHERLGLVALELWPEVGMVLRVQDRVVWRSFGVNQDFTTFVRDLIREEYDHDPGNIPGWDDGAAHIAQRIATYLEARSKP